MTVRRIFLFLVCIFILSSQVSCGIESTKVLTVPETPTSAPSTTKTSTPTLNLTASPSPSPTMDATQRTWYATAIVVVMNEQIAQQQTKVAHQTQVAQFPSACDKQYYSYFSPDGEWSASTCGYKDNETLIVQNKTDAKWILEPKDFLNSTIPDYLTGWLQPIFWSPDNSFLYFTIQWGYSGGGDLCFPEYMGYYGLFRLNLSTGLWATVIPSTSSFPGYEIEFSPTGRRYAITSGEMVITDLKTGETITNLPGDGVVERMMWSPDGMRLAYSISDCDEEKIISSSLYIWEAATNTTEKLAKIDGTILEPEYWIDNSTLRVVGREAQNQNWAYTIYQYSIEPNELLSEETATPPP